MDAILHYFKAVENPDRDVKYEAMIKLANCYRLTGQFEEAEEWYKKIFKRKRRDPENILNYAKALKSSAKYAEAAEEFSKYAQKNSSDPMGKIYVESCRLAQQWLDEPVSSEVRNVEILNTTGSEYSPVYFKDGIIFTSSRDGGTKKLLSFNGGNNEILTDLYYVNLNTPADELTVEKMSGLNTPYHEVPE